jgi:3-oxoacyl-[acyl-carrier-protein] synthase I
MHLAPLKIVSTGMVTSLGSDGASSAAAIRAGLDCFSETSFIDTLGEQITGSPIALNEATKPSTHRQGGVERFVQLCALAIEECAINANLPLPLEADISVFILGDDTRPKPIQDIIEGLLEQSNLFSQENSHTRLVQAFMHGEASLIHALATANTKLTVDNRYILLVTIDSWLNTQDIETCLHQNRLSTSSSSGFIPGEAAAACLITRSEKHTHELAIKGLGVGEEKAHLLTEHPCYGIGLAAAMKQALSQAKITADQINFRLSDLNGEQYFFEEAAYAWARVLRNPLPDSFTHTTIAAHTGHLGCALGLTIIAYLWNLLRNNRLTKGNILIHFSSIQTLRGAVVLQHNLGTKE